MALERYRAAHVALGPDVRGLLERAGVRLERPDLVANLADTEEDALDFAMQLKDPTGAQAVSELLWCFVQAARVLADSNGQRFARARLIEGIGRLEAEGSHARASYYHREALKLAAAVPPRQSRGPRNTAEEIRLKDVEPDARAKLEDLEKNRWTRELVDIIIESKHPLVNMANTTKDPEGTMMRCVGSLRSSTIRKRVRTWRRVRLYTLITHGVSWPAHAGQVVDYLDELAQEPCRATVPRSVLQSLAFIEAKGEVPLHVRLSEACMVKDTVEHLTASLSAATRPPKKAPAFLVVVLVSMEILVMDTSAPLYLRAFCWVKLLKVWMALRSDDTEGLVPGDLAMTERGLSGLLDRTKVSGPGRKVRWLPVFIRRGACVAVPEWLETGYGLWTSPPLNFQRDYMVPLSAKGWDGVRRAPAGYSDMVTASRAVFRTLKVPVWDDDDQWLGSDKYLLDGPLITYWTEHSERNFLNNHAATKGIPESERDYIGRWAAEQSDEYLKTARGVVHSVQQKITNQFVTRMNEIDEDDAKQELKRYLEKKAFSEDDIEYWLDRLDILNVMGLTPANK